MALNTYREMRDTYRARREWSVAAVASRSLGQTYARAGEYQNAITALDDALLLFDKVPGHDLREDRASCLVTLAGCYRKIGRQSDARSYLDAAAQLLGDKPGPSIVAAEMYHERGEQLSRAGDWEPAQTALKAALAALPDSPMTVIGPVKAEVRDLLSNVELALGHPDLALKELEEARNVYIRWRGPWHVSTAEARFALGCLQWQLGDATSARRSLEDALSGLVSSSDSLRLVAESEAIRRLARINYARDVLLSVLRNANNVAPSELYGHVWRTKGLLTRHSLGRFAGRRGRAPGRRSRTAAPDQGRALEPPLDPGRAPIARGKAP